MLQPLSNLFFHGGDANASDSLHLAQNATALDCAGPLWAQGVCLRLTQSAAICVDSRLSLNMTTEAGPAIDSERDITWGMHLAQNTVAKVSPSLGLEHDLMWGHCEAMLHRLCICLGTQPLGMVSV